MIAVTWKWRGPEGRPQFHSEHVNVLRAMLERHGVDRLVCFSDSLKGLDPRIDGHPLPDTGLEALISPQTRTVPRRFRYRSSGRTRAGVQQAKQYPSCYRRLWLFSEQAAEFFAGEHIMLIDIDCIIVSNLAPIVETGTAHPFVGWIDGESFEWPKVAGGFWSLKTGAHPEVWRDFDPDRSPAMCEALGFKGSDQAWLSHKLGTAPAFDPSALAKINWLPRSNPGKAIIAFTAGHTPPWDRNLQRRYSWVRQHWAL